MAAGRFVVPGLVRMVPLWGCCRGTAGRGVVWLVFGTLLGPEATGPGGRGFGCGFSGLFVSGFLAASIARVVPFGVCVGCVVRGCCLRTT